MCRSTFPSYDTRFVKNDTLFVKERRIVCHKKTAIAGGFFALKIIHLLHNYYRFNIVKRLIIRDTYKHEFTT